MPASRRQFMTRAGFLAAGATLAAPTLAESSPETRWTLTSAFQPGFDFLYGGAETFAAALSDMTDGQFTVKVRPAGDIAGALDALDAVAEGKAECAHTALSYSWTKDPAYLFGSGAPFGMNARQHAAWLEIGGGNALIDESSRGSRPERDADGRHGRPDGRLVPQGSTQRRRIRRHESPDRRLCRKGVRNPGRNRGQPAEGQDHRGASEWNARRLRVGRPL